MFVDDEYALSVYFLKELFCCGFLSAILYLRQRRIGPRVKYRWLAGYWLVFLTAMTFWWLDKTRVLCSPGNHWISGHGVWHLLDALALYLVYLFYRQFEILRFRGLAHGSARI
jgi:hypothetical protein